MQSKENKALRYNQGKPKWGLVHFGSLEGLVRVLEFGAKKYSADNWKNKQDLKEILESLSRHLFALMDGEEIDPESGLHHIDHVMANSMFFKYHFNLNNLNNLNETNQN